MILSKNATRSPVTLTIEGTEIHLVTPEGSRLSMPLAELLKRLAGVRMDTGGLILPDGLKSIVSQGPVSVWIHETPPRVWSFRWIRDDSAARHGVDATYRVIRIALPYLILVGVFHPDRRGRPVLSQQNECFFRVAPLSSMDDELLYPALLNCSKFDPPKGRPLSWICTQYLDRRFDADEDEARRMCRSFEGLRHCLVETGFNYSSEHHELASWFTASRGIDSRIDNVREWEKATIENPLFVLDIPWLKTGYTANRLADRIFANHQSRRPDFSKAASIARLIANYHHEDGVKRAGDAFDLIPGVDLPF